ncbi:MAG: 3-phosphoshikimate 1-carboxyvinyltransferase [Bacteroidaceae bacterium]|nr:3-phosphoshikimate 1-carboxyvinyltransferase [Bacteroidaceae bacterium]
MSRIRIKAPKAIHSTATLPASKSISNRALIINALSKSGSEITNISTCDDTFVMVRALKNPAADTIDIMAAGTAMRFLTAYLSAGNGEHTITGTERMRNRPIGVLVNALRSLGASISYAGKNGFPPLRIVGTALQGGEISIPGNVSSQYISALLMIAPLMKYGLKLSLTGEIVSRPYIDMTISIMKTFGARVGWATDSIIIVEPKPYKATPYTVENDWSAASYWYEIAALIDDAEIELPSLFADSLQGDCKIADIFSNLGVSTSFSDGKVIIRKTGNCVREFDYDFVFQPDLAQTVVVACCMLGVKFRFTGLQSLKIKETDRIEALKCELRKLGFVISDYDDSRLEWNGERCEPTGEAIDTYEDHRMAMAFAPCSITLGHIDINNPQVVSKSYPEYWDSLKAVGFVIEE